MLPAASLYEVISVLIDSLVVFCKRVDYRSINYQLPHFFFLLLNTSKIQDPSKRSNYSDYHNRSLDRWSSHMRDRLSEIVAQTVKFSVLVLHTTQFQFKWPLAVAKAKTHTWVRPAKSFYTRLFELRIDRLNAQTID